ncbi:MAG: immune inhibitor A domain-containing protein, partial [Candidatus Poseidoniales archaeon]
MRRAAAALMAFLFMTASVWMFLNEETVEAWLSQQVVNQADETAAQLPLQDNESWLVVVVDFEENAAGNGWGPDEAQTMLDQAVVPYVEQLSGGVTDLSIDVHQTVVRAEGAMSDYGRDGTGKDTDSDGSFLPSALAEEAVLGIKQSADWARYDLDGDGKVDRFMVLHTTKGQEENPGISNRIWSHYTEFETPIDLGDGINIGHYTMASLQTGTSGIGTIIHEMLHQMGAIDLYPVHDEVNSQSWKGPGDWDIMASGNWNGGGRWPAMPTGANVELVRPERVETLQLEWPEDANTPCLGPTVALVGISEGGTILKIPIGQDESVFIEHRSDSGYDSRLPGNGVLVSYQDLSVGDMERNEVNTNPNTPWLKVIEADEGDDLVRGSNQGEASDLFLNNTTFGAEGVAIRTHDGVLVPWVATINGEENMTVSFEAPSCTPGFEVNMDDHGSTVLPDQSPNIDLIGDVVDCSASLTSSDGRGVDLVSTSNGYDLAFASPGVSPSTAMLRGTITCDDGSVNIEHAVQVFERIPVPSLFEATVHPSQPTTLSIPIESVGHGEQRYSVVIDGPLSRIASGETSINLNGQDTYELTIEPGGLLSESMLIFGTIHLMTQEGMQWTVEVELQATAQNDAWWMIWTEPGRVVGLMFLVLALSSLGGVVSTRAPASQTDEHGKTEQPVASVNNESTQDAWGRQLDDEASPNA